MAIWIAVLALVALVVALIALRIALATVRSTGTMLEWVGERMLEQADLVQQMDDEISDRIDKALGQDTDPDRPRRRRRLPKLEMKS